MELTNEVIEETRTDLDLLTSLTFVNPPRTSMYRRIKRWVAQAYEEICMAREEWQFKAERTVVTVRPRIRVSNVSPAIIAGDHLIGTDSGVSFVVVNVVLNADDPDGDVYLDFLYDDEDDNRLVLGEVINRIAPSAPVSDIAMLEGVQGYDFSQYIPTVEEVDITTLYVQDVPNSINDDLPGAPQYIYPADETSIAAYTMREWEGAGKPQYVHLDPQGYVQFFPRINKPYSIILPYSRTVKTMDPTLYTDTFWPIPVNLQKAIVWRAVMKYAKFDNKSKLYLDARDEWRYWNNLLEKKNLPQVKMPANRFWA